MPLERTLLFSLWSRGYNNDGNRLKFDKLNFIEEQNEEAMNANLDFLEERQDSSQMKLMIHQRKMERHFHFKVHRKTLEVEKLIFKSSHYLSFFDF